MKQGTGNVRNGQRKSEPRSMAVNPGYADSLGQHFGNHDMEEGTFTPRITPMDAGRGYSAPGIASTTHKRGSQGRY